MTAEKRMKRSLAEVDPEIFAAIQRETERQAGQLELIASENFTSEAVLEATGSVFTNKYAEGYPGKRYYGGCEFTDIVENLARERGKKLFGAEYINVQPHSGSQANQAAYASVLQPGDTIMGLNLAHGGHLTHGHQLNFSGKTYHVVPYGVRREDERIDYDEMERLAHEHKPKMIIAGASAYPRIIDFARIRQIADAVSAVFLVDMAHISGLVAAGVHPNPCEHADMVTLTGINGQTFDMGRIDVTTKLGTSEIWEVVSAGMAHPFHIHGALFRILSIAGAPPPAHLAGWKDVVLVEDTAELLVAFNQPATRDHPFMYHCHILEHEEAGLMGQYVCA